MATPAESAGTTEVDLAEIRPNPHQPRRKFDPQALDELAASIRQHGVLQPVVLRRTDSGYELVAGERRWRAARLAGRQAIPALVREGVSDAEMLELALVENVQRVDLNPIERAEGFQAMLDKLGLSQEQVAERVGLERSTVANHLRLLELPAEIQRAVIEGLVSMSHARALAGLRSAEAMRAALQRVVAEGLSVRQVEELARDQRSPAKPVAKRPASAGEAWARELEARIRERLGVPVRVLNGPGYRGRIVLQYFDRKSLDRLCDELVPRERV